MGRTEKACPGVGASEQAAGTGTNCEMASGTRMDSITAAERGQALSPGG